MILPEALKLLPVYMTGLLKCDAIDGGPEVQPDDKALAQLRMLGAHPALSQVFLYPRLLKIEVIFTFLLFLIFYNICLYYV